MRESLPMERYIGVAHFIGNPSSFPARSTLLGAAVNDLGKCRVVADLVDAAPNCFSQASGQMDSARFQAEARIRRVSKVRNSLAVQGTESAGIVQLQPRYTTIA